jgi:prepilin peptidase CpaA
LAASVEARIVSGGRGMTLSALAATLGLVFFPLAMVYAGLMDLVTLKIRNNLVMAVGIGWLVLAPLAGFQLSELGLSGAVALLVFAITFTFFALGWIGGGDAKLAAVTALWFQPQEALLYFIYASLLGGLLTLVILQLRARMLPAVLYRVPWIAQLNEQRGGVPYGAAMAPAALIVFPQTAWVAHAVF